MKYYLQRYRGAEEPLECGSLLPPSLMRIQGGSKLLHSKAPCRAHR